MADKRIIYRKQKRRHKLGYRLLGALPSWAFTIKNECQYPFLAADQQATAAKAYSEGTLDSASEDFRCKCGAKVGAKKTSDDGMFGPTRHAQYKTSRPRALKRTPRK